MQTEGLANVIQVLRLSLRIFTTAETPSQAMSDCWRNAGSSSRSILKSSQRAASRKNGSLLYTIIPLQGSHGTALRTAVQCIRAYRRAAEGAGKAGRAARCIKMKCAVIFWRFSLHSVITVDQNRGVPQACRETAMGSRSPANGAATPRDSDAHKRIAVPRLSAFFRRAPLTLCVKSTKTWRGQKAAKFAVLKSSLEAIPQDRFPKRVKQSEGSDTTPIRNRRPPVSP